MKFFSTVLRRPSTIGLERIFFSALSPALLFATLFLSPYSHAQSKNWSTYLATKFGEILDDFDGTAGIYIKDLRDNRIYSHNAGETYYFASGVKLFALLELFRLVKKGELSLLETWTVDRSFFRDGVGSTHFEEPGARISYRTLAERMMTESDNTATDVIFERVGIGRINQLVQNIAPGEIFPVISILEVRQQLFGQIHRDAYELTGLDYFRVWAPGKTKTRLARLSKRLKLGDNAITSEMYDEAAEKFYGLNWNSGSLIGYGKILEKIVRGELIDDAASSQVLEVMKRCRTGRRRLSAGLPRWIGFAHKTGTQHRRICDLGVAGRGRKSEVILAVCMKGFSKKRDAESRMAKIGKAFALSGILATSE